MSPSIEIIDCTLREGEQSAGVWLSVDEKLALLDMLMAAGVKVVDAGMPSVSDAERDFFRRAAGRPELRLGASTRARSEDVAMAIECGADDLFVICPVSRAHRTRRLGLSRQAFHERIRTLIEMTHRAGCGFNLIAEDASRAGRAELLETLAVGVEARVDRVVLCDTVGVWTPQSCVDAVQSVLAEHPELTLGVHCHNDFGMATANTIAAVQAGVHSPTVTVNGIGERAGNASLIEVALASEELLGRPTGFKRDHLVALSEEVERLTGILVPQHQPIVGFNAFRHESGIHVDGVLKDPTFYESLTPQTLGRQRTIVLGKHSGRAALKQFAEQRGLPSDVATIDRVLSKVKSMQPPRARDSFLAVRHAIDRYNETCLGLPEGVLKALLLENG